MCVTGRIDERDKNACRAYQLCAIEVVAHHNLQLTINNELASSYSDTVWNVAYFQTQFGMIKLSQCI